MKSKLLFCLLLMMSIKTTIAQTISIPDSNFEQALIDAGQDSDGIINGLILQSDAESILNLSLNNKGINSLQGIEGFINVTSLVCSNNNLTSLNVSNNTALLTLQCHGNNLLDLDLSYNTVLTTLTASSNQLTSLDVSTNVALTYLSVPFNQLTSLNVSNNTALVSLFCTGNAITSLDVSNLSNLETLHCYNNELTSINLTNAQALNELQCYGNQLSSLNVSTNINLEELRVSDNNITSLDVSSNLALIDFRAWGNQLTSVDISNNPELEVVSFGDNNLTSFNAKNGNNTAITYFSTSNNTNLLCIDVDDAAYSTANWTTISPLTSFSEDCIASAPTISIPDNNFEQALIDLGYDTNGLNGNIMQIEAEAVTSLDVNSQNISNLQGIEGFINLSVLKCHTNNLTSLDVSNNTSLVQLNCRTNQLTSLDVSANVALEVLNCYNNQITSLDLRTNIQLRSLLCDDNDLTELSVKNGNNTNVTFFSSLGNYNLHCIEVDDEAYSTANWPDINSQSFYSDDCHLGEPTIAILDENFEIALIDLGYDTNGLNGNIWQSEAEALTSLNLNNKNISSLVGIEGFVNLTDLTCKNNLLTALDVSNNVNLTQLNCENNQLAALTLGNNTVIYELFASNNQLTALDIDNNSALSTLFVSNNLLTDFDVSNNFQLFELYIESNQLTSLNLKNGNNAYINDVFTENNSDLFCIEVDDAAYSTANWTYIDAQTNFSEDCSVAVFPTIAIPDANFEQVLINQGYDSNGLNGNILQSEAEAIEILSVSNANISSLEGISGFINLIDLRCDNNVLTFLDVSNLPLLKILYTDQNNLAEIDVSSNLELQNLNVSSNHITALDISVNSDLVSFEANENNLQTLNVKNTNNANFLFFSALDNPNLYCIEVDDATYSNANWNQVDGQTNFSEDCSIAFPTIAIPDANFEQALIDLGYDTNGFTGNIFISDAEVITSLNVSNKNISSLSGIEGFSNLIVLKIEHNDLNSLQGLENLTNLETLTCNGNNLTSLDISNLTNLKELHTGSNPLGSIDVSNNVLLESLTSSTCQLTSIDVSNNLNLNYLEVYDNQLTTLNISNNLDLEYLSFDTNQITSINLSNHVNLVELYAANNQLTSLNIKNGNNTIITDFSAENNPDLYCIEVDSAPYSTALWSSDIDAQASFSEDCSTLTVDEVSLTDTLSLYPNPASEVFYIKGLQEDTQINVYDINGRNILSTNINNRQPVNVSQIPSGIYLVNIKNNTGETVKKLIVN